MRPATGPPAAWRLAPSRGEQDLRIERRFVSKKKRRTEFEGERPPDAKAPPRAGKVMREGPPDTASVRAKSSGHGKKTADKWNQ
jgi:hypothetical protein